MTLKISLQFYDRGLYFSWNWWWKTIGFLDSKFLIRLPKNVFKRQIKKIKTNDETIEINMTNSRLKYFNDIKLREKVRKNGANKNHKIALVDIGNDELEYIKQQI